MNDETQHSQAENGDPPEQTDPLGKTADFTAEDSQRARDADPHETVGSQPTAASRFASPATDSRYRVLRPHAKKRIEEFGDRLTYAQRHGWISKATRAVG